MAAEGVPQRIARLVFFLCLSLQLPVLPLYPLSISQARAEEGVQDDVVVDRSASPDYVSVLQVAMAIAGAPMETQNPNLLAVAFLPGALAHEVGNLASCDMGIKELCTEGRLYNWTDWTTIGTQPQFAPSALKARLVETYPTKGRELVAGCFISLAAALMCLYSGTKAALVGVGLCIYAVSGEGLKMAPWVGLLVSSAVFAAGLLEVKPPATKQAAGGSGEDMTAAPQQAKVKKNK